MFIAYFFYTGFGYSIQFRSVNGTDVKLHDYSNVLPAIMHVIRELQGFDF